MKITDSTVLITGGGSGIGYTTARYLSGKGNRVIILGRNLDKIKKAGEKLGLTAIACDVTKAADIADLVIRVEKEFGDLSVLINNAGVAHLYRLGEGANAFEKSKLEFETNYFAPRPFDRGTIANAKKTAGSSNSQHHFQCVLPSIDHTADLF